eukprot:SAG31_NODE_7147_length_1776_cov_1.202743_2_plen_175_part_00
MNLLSHLKFRLNRAAPPADGCLDSPTLRPGVQLYAYTMPTPTGVPPVSVALQRTVPPPLLLLLGLGCAPVASQWHDIAGALTHDGVHHVFQGCPRGSSGPKGSAISGADGWHHAGSTDLVHWDDRGIGPSRSVKSQSIPINPQSIPINPNPNAALTSRGVASPARGQCHLAVAS